MLAGLVSTSAFAGKQLSDDQIPTGRNSTREHLGDVKGVATSIEVEIDVRGWHRGGEIFMDIEYTDQWIGLKEDVVNAGTE